ncbi:MAG: DUF4380 domain-containing protein [Fimbriimonadales bacterium]|nr:DUF4380 domain-containing protein [Fimbriimonadales bacterium]
MEEVLFEGWRCARLVSGNTEAFVTLDVGPRVIRYGFVGGPNFMHVAPETKGLKGGSEYRSYGGHRLWIAPEDWERTYVPENEPVEVAQDGDAAVFRSDPDRWGIQKEIRLTARPELDGFGLLHVIHNRGSKAVELAPWCLTVMGPGGVCLFPQAPFVPHSEDFLPARPLVLWGYTNMQDPRWTWGRRVIRLRQDALPPQKVGAQVSQGYAAYANHGALFLKRFPFEQGARYPDFGCNFETFTREDMLEVESLGPLTTLEPGTSVELREAWYLVGGFELAEEEDRLADTLDGLASTRPL